MRINRDIRHLLQKLCPNRQFGSSPVMVTGITQDSRQVEPGFVFAARKGRDTSGLDFVSEAIKRGAVVIMTDESISLMTEIHTIKVGDFRQALATLALEIYDQPSERLKLIGITGTNGKTTSTFLVQSIASAAGLNCGLSGTVGYNTVSERREAMLTTPDIDMICQLLAEMVKADCEWAVMEVSSHALAQRRVDGLDFAAVGFTNLTRDHLDYHGSFEKYASVKARLFEMMDADGPAVVNAGDRWGRTMMKAARGHLISYGPPESEADLVTEMISHDLSGGVFNVSIPPGSWIYEVLESTMAERQDDLRTVDDRISFEVRTPLIGLYHSENIALAAGICMGLGAAPGEVEKGIETLGCVSGRMESVAAGQPFAIMVDYSHTPDALERALKSLRPMCRGKLMVVFGCGGNRDVIKRPQMGQVAGMLADRVIITSDNPRFEDPEVIIAEIVAGFPTGYKENLSIDADRRTAIKLAIETANEGDIVLLAGKGHETYQETNGVKVDFDDREVAREAIKVLGWHEKTVSNVNRD